MQHVAPPRDPIFACAGDMAERCAAFDWSTTPLGEPATWPNSLRTTVSLVLRSHFPMIVTWGDEFVMIYNDDYISTLGAKHPAALGSRLPDEFAEIWDDIGPRQRTVLQTGESQFDQDVAFAIDRGDGPEESFFTFSWSHIVPDDPDTGPGGVLTVLSTRTREVVGSRRLTLLNELAARTFGDNDPDVAMSQCLRVLSAAVSDLTFGRFYKASGTETLAGGPYFGIVPPGLPTNEELPEVVLSCRNNAAVSFSGSGDSALVALPICARGRVAGILLLAPHPHRPLDQDHRQWLGIVADRVSQVLSNATSQADERARLLALAEVDTAKTDFLAETGAEDAVLGLDGEADASLEEGADSSAASPGVDRPTILVVDDNAAMRDRVARVLAPLGRVVTCGDGMAALEAIEAQQIDLVVTVLMMPGPDGLNLVQRLRADPRHDWLPVVVLSVRDGSAAATAALEVGADDFVVKPFTSAELLARCRSTLALTRLRADRTSARAHEAVLAGVSHEMQTPLSVIMSALDLITAPETEEKTRVEAARRATLRLRILDRLVRQLLDWSRITAGSPIVVTRSTVSLDELLDRVLAEHAQVRLSGAESTSPRMVICDVRRTEQILHALIVNASQVRASRVEVEVVESRDSAGAIAYYNVLVRDDGPGIDAQAQRGLFTPLTVGPNRAIGGIGLSVSRFAARAQDGDLTLGSSDQRGSVFVLRLPAGACDGGAGRR